MRRWAPAALLAALSAASCGAPLIKLPQGPGTPAPDAAAAAAQATATCREVKSLSAEVGVRGSVGGRRIRGRLLVGLAGESQAYIEAPAPFGAPVFVFSAASDTATLLLPRDRRVLEGGDPAAILEAIAGVPLATRDLHATLTGCAVLPAGGVNGSSLGEHWRTISGPPVLYLQRESSQAPWRIAATIREGEHGWRTDYAQYGSNGLPRTVRLISIERGRFDLRLELSGVEINGGLDPSTFRVSVPAGAAPITIEELRAGGPLAQ